MTLALALRTRLTFLLRVIDLIRAAQTDEAVRRGFIEMPT
jgi:hypothetical protein